MDWQGAIEKAIVGIQVGVAGGSEEGGSREDGEEGGSASRKMH